MTRVRGLRRRRAAASDHSVPSAHAMPRAAGDYPKLYAAFASDPNTDFTKPGPAVKDPDGACVHETDCDWEKWTVCVIEPMAVADAVAFVACMDTSNATDASSATRGCAAAAFDAAKTCHDGDDGHALLAAAAARYTAAVAGEAHQFIPDVFINGEHQIPAYSYDRLVPAICAAGSTASVC